mgnify:CR=1 FL=1
MVSIETIEILDLECVFAHETGVQIENNCPIDLNTSGLLARFQKSVIKDGCVIECLLMKFPADQYYCVYFCMLEEPAMVKPLKYSSEFFSIQLVTQAYFSRNA